MDNSSISFLRRTEIAIEKWDACIQNASNGLIYAQSAYLDIMAENWNALVLDNYKYVMPLPSRKKFGLQYLFQPFLTPVLGVFGNHLNPEIVRKFLHAIPKKFKYWDISLNHENFLQASPYPTYIRTNFVLSLDQTYERIRDGYRDNITRNVSKAIKEGCQVRKNIPIEEVILNCAKSYPGFTRIEKGAFDLLKKVFLHYHSRNEAVTYGIYRNGSLVSCAAFLFGNGRAYYWLVDNQPGSKKLGSSPLLIDAFIKEHAEQKTILDFEGSDEASISTFYGRFGAFKEEFQTIYLNKLPFPLSLFKGVPPHYRKLTRI